MSRGFDLPERSCSSVLFLGGGSWTKATGIYWDQALLFVSSVAGERKGARAGSATGLTRARIITLVGGHLLLDSPQNGASNVVLAFAAGALSTGKEEERRGVLDDDALDVSSIRDANAVPRLVDLDLERCQLGDNCGQAGSLVLATAAFGHAFSGCAATAEIQGVLFL